MFSPLPESFVDEVRLEIFDHASYNDNEIKTFIRNSIKSVNFLLRTGHSIVDSTGSIYDFLVLGSPNNDFWEVVKWKTISSMLDHYYRRMVSQGMGVAISLGAERVDTKTVMISLRDHLKDSKNIYKQKAAAYNGLYSRARIL